MDDLKKLLKKEFPCDVCIIKTMCSKSFMDGTACDELKKRVLKRLKKIITDRRIKQREKE
jgi:hypothetical protein